MNLFEIQNNALSFSPVALALEPFKKLWDRDKSKKKEKATAELAAVYYYADMKSDFSDILDNEEKLKQVLIYLPDLGESWEPDELFNQAVEFYKERSNTVTTKLLEDSQVGLNKIGKYLRNVDLLALDDKGRPIYNAKQYADTQKQLGDIIASHNKLEEQVKKEQISKKNSIGSKEKNMFEDGI